MCVCVCVCVCAEKCHFPASLPTHSPTPPLPTLDPNFRLTLIPTLTIRDVPTGSPSRGGDFAVDVLGMNHPSLPTPFYSVPVPISVFMTLSAVFHPIYSPDNSPLSHSVLAVLFLPLSSIPLDESLLQPRCNP